jgi:hypothetical protein
MADVLRKEANKNRSVTPADKILDFAGLYKVSIACLRTSAYHFRGKIFLYAFVRNLTHRIREVFMSVRDSLCFANFHQRPRTQFVVFSKFEYIYNYERSINPSSSRKRNSASYR